MKERTLYLAGFASVALTVWACSGDDEGSTVGTTNAAKGGAAGKTGSGADGTGTIGGRAGTCANGCGDGTGHSHGDGVGTFHDGTAHADGSGPGGFHGADGTGHIDGSGHADGTGHADGSGPGGFHGGDGTGHADGSGPIGKGGAGNGGSGGSAGGGGNGGDGSCKAPCGPGTVCQNTQCVCAGTTPALCGGACADLAIDVAHCGTCETACPVGNACTAGKCACPAANLCAGACVDTAADNANCGKCGEACDKTARCESGVCRERIVLDTAAYGGMTNGAIALHDGYVYWSTDVELRRVKADGTGKGESIIATGTGTGIALDGTTLYYRTSSGLFSAPIGSWDKPTALGVFISEGVGIAFVSGSLYFGSSPNLMRLGLSPAAPAVPFGTTSVANGHQIITDGTHIYWSGGSAQASFQLVRLGVAPGSTEEVLAKVPAANLAVDGDTLYFARPASGSPGVFKLPKSGGTPTSILEGISGRLAVSGSEVFVADGSNLDAGTIRRVDAVSGAATLFTTEPRLLAIAADASHVYYVSAGSLVRRKK